jgi:hypothetical protein
MVAINPTGRGWYAETGQNFPGTFNYFVGDSRARNCTICAADSRNFFVFDLAGVSQPIASAKLALHVPPSGYTSRDPSENYELHDVVTPIESLLDGTGGVAAHTDLGSGIVYGSRTMTAADQGSVIEIELNSSAIAVLNSSHSLFGIGGSLTTLDGVANSEGTFGFTSLSTDLVQLRLTLVPEPSTLLLLLIAGSSLLGYRKAKSHG